MQNEITDLPLPKVSVIIPTYNRANIINQSIDSVRNQTFTDLEIIVVDDGSTDGTEALVKSIPDARIRYFYVRHSGACVARNYGIEKSRGVYIAFNDSDDIWYKDKLESQMKLIHRYNADVVACSILMDDGVFAHLWDNLPDVCKLELKDFFPQNYVSTQTILADRNVFLTERFNPKQPRLQDAEFMIRVVTEYKVVFENVPRVFCHTTGERISNDGLALVRGYIGIMKTVSRLSVSKADKARYTHQIISTFSGKRKQVLLSMEKLFSVPCLNNIILTVFDKYLLLSNRWHNAIYFMQ